MLAPNSGSSPLAHTWESRERGLQSTEKEMRGRMVHRERNRVGGSGLFPGASSSWSAMVYCIPLFLEIVLWSTTLSMFFSLSYIFPSFSSFLTSAKNIYYDRVESLLVHSVLALEQRQWLWIYAPKHRNFFVTIRSHIPSLFIILIYKYRVNSFFTHQISRTSYNTL